METKKAVGFGVILSVAATWFSIHAGGGFASGAQTMGFLTRFGAAAIWTPVLVVVLIAWAYRELLILGKNNNIYTFRQLTDLLYHPYEKVLSPIYEVAFNIANIMAIASCIAGGATVFQSYFKLNYYIGIVVIGVVMLLLCIYGRKLVTAAGTVLSILIFVCMCIICFTAIAKGDGHLNTWMTSEAANSTSFGYVLLKVFSYAGFQCWGPIGGILGISVVLKTNKNINKMLGVGIIINAIMLWLTNFVMMLYMPECTESALPLLWVCENTGNSLVKIAYVVALMSAYISTGVGVVYGLVLRYSPIIQKKAPKAKKSVVNAGVAAFFIILTVLASTIGLTNIINYGFGYMGYVGIVLIWLPAVIVGTIKNRRFAKEHPKFDEENIHREDLDI